MMERTDKRQAATEAAAGRPHAAYQETIFLKPSADFPAVQLCLHQIQLRLELSLGLLLFSALASCCHSLPLAATRCPLLPSLPVAATRCLCALLTAYLHL